MFINHFYDCVRAGIGCPCWFCSFYYQSNAGTDIAVTIADFAAASDTTCLDQTGQNEVKHNYIPRDEIL